MIDKLVVKLLTLKAKLSSERGQDLMEYALITGGLGVAIVGAIALTGLGPGGIIQDWFQSLADAISSSIIP